MKFSFIISLGYIFSSLITCSSEDAIDVKSLQQRASVVYEKLKPCLRNSNQSRTLGRTFDDLHIPDDIVEHYKLLLQKTEKMRKLPVHHGAGYNGPWIENHYINHFMRQPLSYFNGLVPLFVQFVDIHVNDFRTKVRPNPTLKSTAEELTALLRDDILYVAISQDDQGITANLFEKKPNILVLSAGGYGHIPIPLIKGELGYVPPRSNRKYDLDVGFCGSSSTHPNRTQALLETEKAVKEKGLSYACRNGPIHQYSEHTKFNLAPRGYGRSSYRLAEIIQVGRLPVYIYDVFPWTAYEGTEIAIEEFGFVSQLGHADVLAERLVQVNSNESDLDRRLLKAKEVRPHYTYSGLLKQMEQFFQDPLGAAGGFLRCAAVPDTENRLRKRERMLSRK